MARRSSAAALGGSCIGTAARPANRCGCSLMTSARKSLAMRASATAMSGSVCTWIPGLVSDSTCMSTPFPVHVRQPVLGEVDQLALPVGGHRALYPHMGDRRTLGRQLLVPERFFQRDYLHGIVLPLSERVSRRQHHLLTHGAAGPRNTTGRSESK